MIENMHWSQAQLARYWQVSEGTLERWRSEGIGPIFFKTARSGPVPDGRHQCL